jgi:AcrR family transcriptional regulator
VPRPRSHDDDVRTRLLEVASEVISTQGESALTVRDAARRAGTSASAVYALLGSRERLVTAVGQEAVRRFAAHLDAVGRTDDPGADLLALGMAYRDSALDDPHFYRVMFDRTRSPVASTPGPDDPPTFRVLRAAVARVLRSAGLSEPSVAPTAHEGAVGLWALVHGLVSLELSGQLHGSRAELADRYRRMLMAGGPALVAGTGGAPQRDR